jgi:hypothetical protein
MKVLGNILGNILGVALALALTAAFGYYGYLATKLFVVLFARLDFTVAMVTATVVVAVLLAALIIAGSIRRAAWQNRETQRRADKAEAYKLFISVWEGLLRPGQTPEALAHLSRQMQDATHLLVLHGCTAVVKAHTVMPSLSMAEAHAKFAGALLEIRKDLGMESRGLEATELARLLLGESSSAPSSSRIGVREDTQPRVSLVSN